MSLEGHNSTNYSPPSGSENVHPECGVTCSLNPLRFCVCSGITAGRMTARLSPAPAACLPDVQAGASLHGHGRTGRPSPEATATVHPGQPVRREPTCPDTSQPGSWSPGLDAPALVSPLRRLEPLQVVEPEPLSEDPPVSDGEEN